MRPLFAQGSRGFLIKDLQVQLSQNGYTVGVCDGIYGRGTARGVLDFQREHDLPPTGVVDDLLWKALGNTMLPPLAARCLQVTAAFEGHGFTMVRGNFDGAGLTWGIIGFTLKSGSLRTVLLTANQEHPGLLKTMMAQTDYETLIAILHAPWAQRVAWANQISVGTTKTRVVDPWRSYFTAFGHSPEVQRVQLAVARAQYYAPALRSATEMGLMTELGVAICVDCHVQQGSIPLPVRTAVARGVLPEATKRARLAQFMADRAGKWAEDVLERRMAFATGRGTVNGEVYTLTAWGLGEFPRD